MNKRSLKPYLLLLPVLIILVGIFLFGLISGFLQSLGYIPQIGMTDLTLKYYQEILNNPEFSASFLFSLKTSFISAIIAVVIGVLLSYVLIFNKRTNPLISSYKLPFMVPPTVAAILVIMLIGQSGFIPRELYQLGIISEMSEFAPMIYDPNGIGIIVAYVWKEISFITLVTHNILKNIHVKYSKVTASLGANKVQTFFYVLLPLLSPTIATSFIIIFSFAFGAFEIPYLLGASSPKALPVLSYVYYNNVDLTQRPYAMVINSFIVFGTLIMLGCYLLIVKVTKKYNS